MTITIELPRELAIRMTTIPEDERNNFAIAALSAAFDSTEDDEKLYSLIAEGITAVEEGRVRPLRDSYADLITKYGLTAPETLQP